jgi:hypothetical protein
LQNDDTVDISIGCMRRFVTRSDPDFFKSVRAELSDVRVWIDRAIVLGYAVRQVPAELPDPSIP